MSYQIPPVWVPMHHNVPMLGTEPAPIPTSSGVRPERVALMIGAGALALAIGLAVADRMVPAKPRRRVRRNPCSCGPRRTSRNKRRRKRRTSKNGLTPSRRARIRRSAFVFPDRPAPGGGRGTWPLDTERRARAAVDYLRMGRVRNASDFNAIRSKLIRDWPGIWAMYGRGNVTWEKTKRAKTKRDRSRRRRARRAAA